MRVMKFARRFGILATLAIALVLMLIASWRRSNIIGYLRHESIYQGRYTNFWSADLRGWEVTATASFNGFCSRFRDPKESFWSEWLPRWIKPSQQPSFKEHPLMQGDPEALPVLLELLRDPSRDIRLIAAEAIGKLHPPPKHVFLTLMEALHDEEDKDIHREIEDDLFRIDWDAAHDAGLGHLRWWY